MPGPGHPQVLGQVPATTSRRSAADRLTHSAPAVSGYRRPARSRVDIETEAPNHTGLLSVFRGAIRP
jgi:hypothetical protein